MKKSINKILFCYFVISFFCVNSFADDFIHEGGFTEKMSKVRLEQRDEDYKNEGSPNCPKCGNPMRKVVARKGRYAGKTFWGCTSYPECNGTREL